MQKLFNRNKGKTDIQEREKMKMSKKEENKHKKGNFFGCKRQRERTNMQKKKKHTKLFECPTKCKNIF